MKIVNQTTQESEWGMIEFQGDLVGQLEGQVLGQAEIRAVRSLPPPSSSITLTNHEC